MIRYALMCADGHRFESWFQSSGAFERLRGAGHVTCAMCGGKDVTKAVMAPALAQGRAAPDVPDMPERTHPAPGPAPRDGAMMLASPSPEVEAAMRALRAKVEANAENVGARFAVEARAIHLGDAAPRAIYGEATGKEARALVEDGVEISSLPWISRRDS
jgi:hypothetical protein